MSTEPIRVGRDVAPAFAPPAPAASGRALFDGDTRGVHQGAAGLRLAAGPRGARRRAGNPPRVAATGETPRPALRRR